MGFKPILLLAAVILMTVCQADSSDSKPSDTKSTDSKHTNTGTLPRFESLKEGESFPVAVPSSFRSTLGWLVVPEDRGNPQSAAIRLPVAIIHSTTVTSAPPAMTSKSPVVYLSGGPGTSSLRTAQYPGAYPWLKDRDFIVFGQRGTHYAKPALMCPEYRKAIVGDTDRAASVLRCKKRLEDSGIGLHNYNSAASAADLDDLRTALGIKSWNLFGGSYGTRLALVYMKKYGDHVDTAVLDSPLPPNAIYDDQSAVNLERSLRAIAADCANQVPCNTAFPNLEKRFFQTIDAVAKAPLKIEGRDTPVRAVDLVSLVPISSSYGVRRSPLIMDQIARLDPKLLASLSGAPQASNFAWGMRFSVWCSEALPFSERSRAKGPEPILGGYESAAITPELCKAWGVPALDPSAVEPVISAVPTLILAGEFDPFTPPIWGDLAAKTLANSKVVSIRGASHSPSQQWGGDGCAIELAAAFIQSPDAVLNARDADYCVFARPAPDYIVPSDQ